MEFGIFVQGHTPRPQVERNDIELVKTADRYGFKYAWVSEHHFLEEYSHLSANEIFISYAFGVTERIHMGSGIFNLNPQVNHPVRIAERVAMLDHLSDGRFEFGVGRGAGSREVTGFGIESTDATKPVFEEVVREFPRMWRETEYSFQGKYFAVPPRNVLPKPWRKPHPPVWQAAGNPPTYEKAARTGLGVLGFNVASVKDMEPMVSAYKNAIGAAEPIFDYVNDNVMITNGVVCLEDGKKARKVAQEMGISYLQSLVFRYHDTFPRPEMIPAWPQILPEPTPEDIEFRISEGYLLCGDPDEVLAQVKRYEGIGADQLVFGLPIQMPIDAALESIRLFGTHVIPKLDPDPVHRSSKFRDAAAVAAKA
jgi:alkanesulfonate monooxygenase SsuD/methylene tetrahydromethanopterin reductase-like flavin-dependent oxidoreductase (luciferase family)